MNDFNTLLFMAYARHGASIATAHEEAEMTPAPAQRTEAITFERGNRSYRITDLTILKSTGKFLEIRHFYEKDGLGPTLHRFQLTGSRWNLPDT